MIHDRQYVISKKPYLCLDNWKSIELLNGYVLSYSNVLPVYVSLSKRVILLGHAWQVEPNRNKPEEEIESIDLFVENTDDFFSSIYRMEETWNGRYILLVDNWLFLDASGLLGCFYSEEIGGVLSNSLALLCDITGKKVNEPSIEWGKFPDWYIGPCTPINGIRRLMPSQIYNIGEGYYKSRPLVFPHNVSRCKKTEALCEYMTTSVKNMYEHFAVSKFLLGLTTADSRTSLSFMMSEPRREFYSHTLIFSEDSEYDSTIAHQLSDICGVKHYTYTILNDKVNTSKELEFRTHCSGMNVDTDSFFYSKGVYDKISRDFTNKHLVIVRSNVYENVQEYYR